MGGILFSLVKVICINVKVMDSSDLNEEKKPQDS